MLSQPTVNVKEIGRAVGYGDSNYFAKVFKRITGQSPTEYSLSFSRRDKDCNMVKILCALCINRMGRNRLKSYYDSQNLLCSE